jgi:hypothetical protein
MSESQAGTFSGSVDDVMRGVRDLLAKGAPGPVRVIYVELGSGPVVAQNGAVGPVAVAASPTDPEPGSAAYSTQWNLQGHAVIAYMAQSILQRETPDAYQRLQAAINVDPWARGDIGELAMWPDRIKHPPQGQGSEYSQRGWIALGKQTQSMHFVDIPYRPSSNAPPQIPQPITGTILDGLPKYVAELNAWGSAEAGANALAFVLHFCGDIHQPLHCACLADDRFPAPKFDMGGNLIVWGQSEKNPPSFHAFWDDLIAARQQDVFKIAESLLSKYPRSQFEHDLAVVDVQEWALDSTTLARKAYDRFLAESQYDDSTQRYTKPSNDYRAWATEVAQERGALAAYRLADLLADHLPALDAIGAAARNGNGANVVASKVARKPKPARPVKKSRPRSRGARAAR